MENFLIYSISLLIVAILFTLGNYKRNEWLKHSDMGVDHFDNERYDEAIIEFKKAIEKGSKGFWLKFNHGFWLGKSAKDIEDSGIHTCLGAAYFNKGNFKKALEEYNKAVLLNPNNYGAHYNLGHTLSTLGKHDEAIYMLNKAVKQNPDDATVLGLAYYTEGICSKAIIQESDVFTLDTNYPNINYMIGNVYLILSRFDDAIDEFNKALKIDPESFEIHTELARALLNIGKHNKAIDEFNKALKIDPESFEIHIELGRALHTFGKNDEAIKEFNKAVNLNPNDPYAHEVLGFAYYTKGLYDKARIELNKVLYLDPNYPGIILKSFMTRLLLS